MRSSRHYRWLCVWTAWAVLAAPGVAAALTWTVTDPVASPAPDQLAPIAQAWLQGDAIGRWAPATSGPIDARALSDAGPGGTIYAASLFDSDHVGAVAVRVRCDVAFRVWLDGRLIGGVAQARAWSAAPIALPGWVDAGAHRLLVELRPPHDRSAWLAAAITTPAGDAVDLRPIAQAPARAPAIAATPIAIAATSSPASAQPASIWRPTPPPPEPALALPEDPDLDAIRAAPRWPDAAWSLLWDARRWQLDTRQRARLVVGRINALEGVAAARAFLMDFDDVVWVTRDGSRSASDADIAVGAVFWATRADALPADPLGLGAARLSPNPAPVWRLRITLEGPRGWTLARAARGIGGVRVVDDAPGRRRWTYDADAVPAGAAALRVSRADGVDGFVRLARRALRDHLRPHPGQPPCADAEGAAPLTRAVLCARAGADLVFVRAAGRPALEGPVDLADFDAIAGALPDWGAQGIRLDGTRIDGPGVARLTVELTPDDPTPPLLRLEGPCGDGPVADTGALQTEIEVTLAGVVVEPPPSRRVAAGPLIHARHVERTATGWRAVHRLAWTDLRAVTPGRVAAACRQVALP